jgi:(S)-2-hydroxyglutarate dehydrogenase
MLSMVANLAPKWEQQAGNLLESIISDPVNTGVPSAVVNERTGGGVGIVGGGVIGLAVARQLMRARPGVKVTVLEKEDGLARHQTGRNSGVAHAGVYYTPGSLKARLCRRGIELLAAYCREHGVAYDECGKVIVAVEEAELPKLEALHQRAEANGVPGLRMLDAAELREVEPYAKGVAALHSPQSAIVDFPAFARSLAGEVKAGGGEILTGSRVRAIDQNGSAVRVETDGGNPRKLAFEQLVVCAGLHSDRVAALAGDGPDPRIVPFRGDYYVLRPERRHLVRGLIYPVPDPRFPFLGIHLTKRIDGEVLVGPNAVLAFAREGYRLGTFDRRDLWDTLAWPGFRAMARRYWRTGAKEMWRSASRRAFVAEARRYVPELGAGDVLKGPSGVRAQAVARDGSLVDDFRITVRDRVVNVRNAPSPAATSSLAIAEAIYEQL